MLLSEESLKAVNLDNDVINCASKWDHAGNRLLEGWKVKVTQSCPTLCSPMDYTFYEILQARIL